MVGGFNTNVGRQSRVFHVQTESTTRPRPQITTLLFEEGTILHVHRTDWTGQEEGVSLRQRMEAQHSEVISSLKSGALDRELGLQPESPDRSSEERHPAPRRFGDGVIGKGRLDELVLAHLASS